MSDKLAHEYDIFTKVRLKDKSVGIIVDYIGPDYVVDVGDNSSNWDTIVIKAEDIVGEVLLDSE